MCLWRTLFVYEGTLLPRFTFRALSISPKKNNKDVFGKLFLSDYTLNSCIKLIIGIFIKFSSMFSSLT